ncbi:MAG: hypothetical protein ACFFA3_18490 [Promethearchaeota archaeon]
MKIKINHVEIGERFADISYTFLIKGQTDRREEIEIFVEPPLLEIRNHINKDIECLISAFELSNFSKKKKKSKNLLTSNRIEGIYKGPCSIDPLFLNHINDIFLEDYFHAIEVFNDIILLDPNEIKEYKIKKDDLIGIDVGSYELRSWYDAKNPELNKLEKSKIDLGQISRQPQIIDMDKREEIDKIIDVKTMAGSHFSAIGIILTPELYKSSILNIIKTGTIYQVPNLGGYYFVKNYGNNIEYWIAINKKYYVEAGTPYFRAHNKSTIVLESPKQNIEWRYEGGFTATLLDSEKSAYTSDNKIDFTNTIFRFCFDVPDFALVRYIDMKKVYSFSITAFADTIEFFETEEQLLKSQESKYQTDKPLTTRVFDPKTGETNSLELKPGFASKSFIPTGLFADILNQPPQSSALFNGVIKSIKKELNPITKLHFYLFKIESHGIEIDVVADYRRVQEDVKPGNFVTCSAWLIGSCLEDLDKKYLISQHEKCEEIRTDILNNLQEFSSRRDPKPYSD